VVVGGGWKYLNRGADFSHFFSLSMARKKKERNKIKKGRT
jgi:hypothetical protein